MSNKSGTSPQVMSLPQGGGAQQGIGETFTPDLHTGTGHAAVTLELPAGRNGFQPTFGLRYSSGGGNGAFGLGWSLEAGAISRKTARGVPLYEDALDTFILSGLEDLVPMPGGPTGVQRYRPRTEGLFALIDHYTDGTDHWEVRTKDGTTHVYGTPRPAGTAASWRDRAVVHDPEQGHEDRIASWHLTEMRDPFGNRIEYAYRRDSGREDGHFWNQLYLREVRYVDYGPAAARRFLVSVRLIYDDEQDPLDGNSQRARPDPFSDYRSGFEIRTRRRGTWIIVTTHADRDRRSRAYRLVYLDERGDLSDLDERLPANGVSLLSRVELIGFNSAGTAKRELPPLEFGYTPFRPRERRLIPLTGSDLPGISLADPALELADLTSDGLPDLVEMNGAVRYWRNLGGGMFDLPRAIARAPGGARLQDPGVQLLDANGDGRIDLLVATETGSGYFPVRPDGAFDRGSFRPHTHAPTFRLEDAEARLVDLDGNGVTDAIRSGTRLECFFNDPVRGWNQDGVRHVERRALERFPNVSFSDERVRFADMNGDGLQDVVLVYDGNVEYWPSLGRGDWGSRLHMRNGPQLPYGYDPRHVLLGDVDGDGLADVVYVGDTRVDLWLNRSGNAWSETIRIRGTPPVSDADAVRLDDMLGTGVSGILWSSEPRGQPRRTLFYLDLTGGAKPYLLSEIDNGVGRTTRVGYAPSTRFYLADTRQRRKRWRSSLPFPVQVVERIEFIDEVSKGKLTSEFSYHHGYWDGLEREFRGFGRVARLDTETFERYNASGLHGDVAFTALAGEQARYFSPPTLTKTWFHQGPVADASGEWRENDFRSEFWPGDSQLLERPAGTEQLLRSLPRSARRDALRALRGSMVRTELYALDGTAQTAAPFTVTERLLGLREEVPPGALEARRRRIFFPHVAAERTTQWERGDDPLTRIDFVEDYDAHGQARQQTTIALPRRSTRRRPGGVAAGGDETRVLALHTTTDYAVPDAGLHVRDRVAHERTFALASPPGATESNPADLVRVLRDQAAAANAVKETFRSLLDPWTPEDPLPAALELLGHVVTHYDGLPTQAFAGRLPGKVGPFGAPVRTESLVVTSERLNEAYGSMRPTYLGGSARLPAGAPAGVRTRLGYRLRQRSPTGYHDGYYIDLERHKFDFHDGAAEPRGIVVGLRDALGNEFAFTHDSYAFLRTEITDPLGLTTRAQHDYRVLQPRRVTDPNGNRTTFTYTPLGLLAATAVNGKAGVSEGDQARAALEFSYDFLSRPISVRTRRYVHHDTEPGLSQTALAEAIDRVDYSDGFGRLIQRRTQAEDVIFDSPAQAAVFGDAGLPAEQSEAVGTAVGRARATGGPQNVVVSGWKMYDNKGRVVEEYEPFFSTGLDYLPPSEEQLKRKTTYVYDPRGAVVRRVEADGSEQISVFGVPSDLADPGSAEPSPWQLTVYDANDNAGRTAAAHPDASEYEDHWNTPATFTLDALGRTLSFVESTRPRSAPGDPPAPIRELRTISTFDLRGKMLTIVDALGRTALASVFDLLGRPLRTRTLDGGTSRAVFDALGNVVDHRNDRGGVVLRTFDALNRVSEVWARDDSTSPLGLRERWEYGDAGTPSQPASERRVARAANRLGRIYRSYDQAGVVTFEAYDFKGNVLDKVRQVVRDGELLAGFGPPPPPGWRIPAFRPDWTSAGSSVLDSTRFEISFAYDALNRATAIRFPRDRGTQGAAPRRRTLRATYDRAGLLSRISLENAIFVDRIAYDARGRRLLIAYAGAGSVGFMTRYAYEPASGRLTRLRSEPYVASSNRRTYVPAGSVLQDLGLGYDLVGNVVSLSERTPASGVPGTTLGVNRIDRSCMYDPLYRLVSATGRESTSPHATWRSDRRGSDPAATRGYTEDYAYDDAGNLTRLRREPLATGLERTFVPASGGNRLQSFAEAGASLSYAYDANGNMTREGPDRRFDWDYADRLRAFRRQQGTARPSPYVHYLYDSTGRLVKKLVWRAAGDYETTVYVDGLFERRRRARAGATTEHDLLHVIDDRRRIAVVRIGPDLDGSTADPVLFHLGDHLGSSNVLVDPQGAPRGREEYFPYGETSFGGTERNRYRFTGQERDDESGLSYHGQRWYGPWLARWVSCDPVPPAPQSQACNQYSYVRGDPISFTDPVGLQQDVSPELEPKTTDLLIGSRDVSGMFGAFDAAMRDLYKGTNLARSAAALDVLERLKATGDVSAAATVARSVSDLRNLVRAATQGQLEPVGKLLSALLEKNRDWQAIVKTYGNPFDAKLSPEARFQVAQRITEASGRSAQAMNALQFLGKLAIVVDVALASWQVGRGVDQMRQGRTGEGAIDVGEGSTRLGLTIGTYAGTKSGMIIGQAGIGAGFLTVLAGVAAAGSLTLAAETARAGARGEQTPPEIADKFYGTQFSDIYAWQKRSVGARIALGVATSGLSEVWYGLNKAVE